MKAHFRDFFVVLSLLDKRQKTRELYYLGRATQVSILRMQHLINFMSISMLT